MKKKPVELKNFRMNEKTKKKKTLDTKKCHLIETITILNVCTAYEIPWSY